MIKIEDKRGTGRTTRLILLCAEKGWTLVVPTFRHAEYANDIAKKYHLDVPIIHACKFFDPIERKNFDNYDMHYVIDDLDCVLRTWYKVEAYSIEKEDDQ